MCWLCSVFVWLFSSQKIKGIKKEACWTISNITAGNREQIQAVIDAQEHSSFNRCHFTEFADSSLNFELVYYIDTRDFTVAMNEQQAINLGIMEAFAAKGITFAFPTQTLYLEGESRPVTSS